MCRSGFRGAQKSVGESLKSVVRKFRTTAEDFSVVRYHVEIIEIEATVKESLTVRNISELEEKFMLHLQCTKKVLKIVGETKNVPALLKPTLLSWHVNEFRVDRRKLLLFTNDLTYYSVFWYSPTPCSFAGSTARFHAKETSLFPHGMHGDLLDRSDHQSKRTCGSFFSRLE